MRAKQRHGFREKKSRRGQIALMGSRTHLSHTHSLSTCLCDGVHVCALSKYCSRYSIFNFSQHAISVSIYPSVSLRRSINLSIFFRGAVDLLSVCVPHSTARSQINPCDQILIWTLFSCLTHCSSDLFLPRSGSRCELILFECGSPQQAERALSPMATLKCSSISRALGCTGQV